MKFKVIVNMKRSKTMKNKYCNAKKIKAELDAYVMGQEKGTRGIAIAIAQHVQQVETDRKNITKRSQSDNVLLIGPTGCGKTETFRILQSIEKEIECPVLMFNIMDFSATKSWQGDSITNIFNKVLERACHIYHNSYGYLENIEIQTKKIKYIADHAIIFFDEFDKIALDGEGKARNFLKEYQSNLLKIIEGNNYELALRNKNEDDETEQIKITLDSSQMMFIMLGAFDGIENITLYRLQEEHMKEELPPTLDYKETHIGFLAEPHEKQESVKEEYTYEQLIPSQEDIIQYGFMRELVGRINIRTVYRPLKEKELVDILLHCKTSAYRNYQKRFRRNGHSLRCDRAALREIARIAVKRGTGARGLQNVFNDLLHEIQFDLSGDERPIRCLLRGKEIREGKPPLLHDRTKLIQRRKQLRKYCKRLKKKG